MIGVEDAENTVEDTLELGGGGREGGREREGRREERREGREGGKGI